MGVGSEGVICISVYLGVSRSESMEYPYILLTCGFGLSWTCVPVEISP